jgi:hypothetical protein
MKNQAEELFNEVSILFPGAELFSVEIRESYSSEHGPGTRVQVSLYRFSDQPDVVVSGRLIPEVLGLLKAEAARRQVLREHGLLVT